MNTIETALTTANASVMPVSNSTHTFRTFLRRLSLLAILLITFVSEASAAQYVIYNGTHFLAIKNRNNIEATTTFNPATCIWTGPENGASGYMSIEYNGSTYYLNKVNNSYTLSVSTSASSRWNVKGSMIYTSISSMFGTRNYYIYYGSQWLTQTDANDSKNNVLYLCTVESSTGGEITKSYAISIGNVVANPTTLDHKGISTVTVSGGSVTVTTTTTSGYNKYTLTSNSGSGDPIVLYSNSSTPVTTTETKSPTGYSWTLSSTDNASLNSSTTATTSNVVTYSTASATTTQVTVEVRALYTADGTTHQSDAVSTTITLNRVLSNPTSITAQDLTLIAGETGTVAYTLQPSGAYDQVTFDVADESIASIDMHGVATAKKAGSTQFTVTAYNYDDSEACSTSNTITVLQRCATPTVSIENATKKVTITCAEPSDATIYYTTNGTDPTTASNVYIGPFTITSGMVKAIAVRDGWAESFVGSAAFGGSGEDAGNPYLVNCTADLNYIIQHPTYHYKAIADFDASDFSGVITNFTGTFDGQYHVISGLRKPLISTANGATIKNVVLDNVNISGTGNVGGIVATAEGATRIYNCGVRATNGSSIGGGTNTGSIVGELKGNARVINCYSFADITGGTMVGGIVGRITGTVATYQNVTGNNGALVMNCIYYGKPSGTSVYPIYGGNEISDVRGVNTYNYYRLNAGYTGNYNYGSAQPIADDSYLDRFEFYRSILNSHRELASLYCFADVAKYEEIGKWTLNKGIAPFPIIQEWKANTKKTLDRHIPFTANDYAGKQVGSVSATVIINGSSRTVTLPVTDMDTARWDYTYGKVVLPFANEFDGWTAETNNDTYIDRIITGWEITSMNGGTQGNFTTTGDNRYNFADPECNEKDLYSSDNGNYVYAQGGNLVIPKGVTGITIRAHWADAVYLRDSYYDLSYDAEYANTRNIGSQITEKFNGKTVYTDLGDAIGKLPGGKDKRPADQAIVLVGNYHYNQKVVGTEFNGDKPYTIMSIDRDKDQEPDYCWYSYHTTDRTTIGPHRFDFIANVGLGMAARVKGSTPVPTIGIWHSRGWSEYTETYLGIMTECEINSSYFDGAYGGGQNGLCPWIANGGIYHQVVHSRGGAGNQLSYIRVGGKAYIKQLHPGNHDDNFHTTTLAPINVCGGEIEECYLTGRQHKATTTGNALFWCNGGYIHDFLGAYMEPVNGSVTAKIDHGLIDNFYGGGANANKPVTGNINLTINNSYVKFFCGGPKVGDMSNGTAITINADGTTFGEFYGGGYGGTALTREMKQQNASVSFGNDLEFPLSFSNYTGVRLGKHGNVNEIGVGYDFEYFLYSGGSGIGVARFYVDYASLSLATVQKVTSTLSNCTILQDFYGGGCQGRVAGDVNSTLTSCRVVGSVFGGGYTATATPCLVYKDESPTYSKYLKATGSFTPFGTVDPETYYWVQVNNITTPADEGKKEIYTTVDMSLMGEVAGKTTLRVDGASQVLGGVYGGGNMSRVKGATNVTVETTDTYLINEVYGGANRADVGDNTTVNILSGKIGNVFGANNQSGTKSKDITVNVAGGTSNYVYGAGNLAAYKGNPQVVLSDGVVKEAVFGGGFGASAIVTGDPQVKMTGGVVGYTETVDGKTFVRGGDVFGGGNAAAVQGNTSVTISGGEVKHNVYGGGNQADVSGTTNVKIGL